MTLTNPLNQTKTFTPAQFYTYSMAVEKNKSFLEWAKQGHVQVRIHDGRGLLLNTDEVCAYLRSIGYRISE